MKQIHKIRFITKNDCKSLVVDSEYNLTSAGIFQKLSNWTSISLKRNGQLRVKIKFKSFLSKHQPSKLLDSSTAGGGGGNY